MARNGVVMPWSSSVGEWVMFVVVAGNCNLNSRFPFLRQNCDTQSDF